jgi:hypothetical protein
LKLRKIRAVEIADIEGSDAVEGELVGGSAADAELLRLAGRQRTFETKGGGGVYYGVTAYKSDGKRELLARYFSYMNTRDTFRHQKRNIGKAPLPLS